MAWSVPRYTKGRVNAAGDAYLAPHRQRDSSGAVPCEDWTSTLVFVDWDRISRIRDDQNAINNWRSSHNLPLFVIRRALERRAKSISSEAVVAHRIKRLPSIEKKLLDNQYRHL
jgi:hypothetical protein